MKKVLILFVLTVAILFAKAQIVKPTFTIGIEPSVPIGKLNETHYFGIGGTIEMESRAEWSSLGYIAATGYSYVLGRGKNQSFVQLPALVGGRYHVNDVFSLSQTVGVSFFNEAIGFRATGVTTARVEFEKLAIDLRFIACPKSGEFNTFNSVGLRLGYKL